MPTSIKPLFGSAQNSFTPFCYLLEIDEAKILLDCGCFERGQCEISADPLDALEEAYLLALEE